MVFSSLSFLIYFLPLFLTAYFMMPSRKWKNAVLILASLIFYSWGEPFWVILMIISAMVDYSCGLMLHSIDCQSEHVERKIKLKLNKISYENVSDVIIKDKTIEYKRYLVLFLSLMVNLGFLGYFKYRDFFVDNINYILGTHISMKNIMIPIGISFYTFQTLSYTIDMFRKKAIVQKNFFDFLLYVSLFPQLVAGPIVRYVDISDEIVNRKESWELFSYGVHRFCMGLAKKVMIANTAGYIASVYLEVDMSQLTVVGAWMGIFLYAMQIYFDFSGYSDMAIGLGRMLGFHFKENFEYPYTSKSVTEFWRRWHISLTSFFRDYIYISLGGNKKHMILNMFIVWFLSGLWHGASWNFVLWGLYFGFFIMIELLFLNKILSSIPVFFRQIYLLVVVVYGWTLFYFADLSNVIDYTKILFGFSDQHMIDRATYSHLLSNVNFIILTFILSMGIYVFLGEKYKELFFKYKWFQYGQPIISISLLLICIMMIVGQSYNPFLYFQF